MRPKSARKKKKNGRSLAAEESWAEFIEPLQLVKYVPGQYYRAHLDTHQEPERLGSFNGEQRVQTLLVFVSSVPESDGGGHLHFPLLDLRILPKAGTAVLWKNCRPKEGTALVEPDPCSLHEGEPPLSVEKVAMNVWVVDRPFSKQAVQEAMLRRAGLGQDSQANGEKCACDFRRGSGPNEYRLLLLLQAVAEPAGECSLPPPDHGAQLVQNRYVTARRSKAFCEQFDQSRCGTNPLCGWNQGLSRCQAYIAWFHPMKCGSTFGATLAHFANGSLPEAAHMPSCGYIQESDEATYGAPLMKEDSCPGGNQGPFEFFVYKYPSENWFSNTFWLHPGKKDVDPGNHRPIPDDEFEQWHLGKDHWTPSSRRFAAAPAQCQVRTY
ncbi:unnamed protein product [Effrenium voratum]|uniref:Fe2OG dioxygenase domain-containing protein n=1 Tax=Effrenium voratum TaxID=2562239 RepID=A0AA36N3X7_9DINO|nr:unnamed protein product [Effrenium voratum]